MTDPESRLAGFFRLLVNRPIAVLMIVLAMMGMGLIAASRIPIELQPAGFTNNRISILTSWNGANPQEIEKQILRPLEEQLRTIRGVNDLLAFANQGSGGLIVLFPGTTDMDLAYAEVSDRVERVRSQLPREVDRVFIRRFTTADMPVMWCGLLYPPEQAERAQAMLSDVLQPRLEAVDGVANVRLEGLEPRSVRIWLDEERVSANNVDIGRLVANLQQDNLSLPVGDLDDAGARFIVRVDGLFTSLEDIEDFPVRPGLKIRDIGRVVEVRSAPDSLFRVNGEYGVGIAVTKESSANTFEVCSSLRREIEEEFPADPVLGRFKYKVFWNAGKTIQDSLVSLIQDAVLGGLIACVVLMLFLRRLRFTLLIALSIPFSVILTLTWLYFSGDSFNLLSMMGITISVGMLVDNSVVIVESIFKRREQGQGIDEAVTQGPAEVMLAVVTATLTTVVVFLPLIFMSEDRNQRLAASSIGVPLCVSLLAALFLAVIIVPVASRYFTHEGSGPGLLARLLPVRARRRDRRFGLRRWLPSLVAWSLHHRFLAMSLAGLFFFSGMVARSNVQEREGGGGFHEFQVDFDLSANTTLALAEQEVVEMERVLLGPLRAAIGNPDIGIGFSRRGGEINLWHKVRPPPRKEKEIRRLLRENLPRRPAVEYQFEDNFDRQNVDDKRWTQLVVEGPETRVVNRLAERVRAAARASHLFAEVAEPEDPAREMLLTLDRDRMQRLGITSQRVLGSVEWTLRGFMISRFQTGKSDIPIIIEFDEPSEPDRSRLEEMQVAEFAGGAGLPLGTVASFEHRAGPRGVFRRNGQTQDVVGLKAKSEDLKDTSRALTLLMAGVDIPEGYSWRQAGGLSDFQENMRELFMAFLLAVALVFFLMGLLFESLLLPLSVLLTIPFAVAGANWAFRLSDEPLDAIGYIGMIVLAGVVVNNGIVLLDRILRLRRAGMPREEAILTGVRDRIRPVLMTALTTITGLLPIALSTPDGNGFSFKGLAIGVAGGLACTTFFTLWVVPLAYSLFDDLGLRLRGLFVLPRIRR